MLMHTRKMAVEEPKGKAPAKGEQYKDEDGVLMVFDYATRTYFPQVRCCPCFAIYFPCKGDVWER
jgi:nitrate reductase beta subunit